MYVNVITLTIIDLQANCCQLAFSVRSDVSHFKWTSMSLLALSVRVTRYTGDNTNLPSNIDISKTEIINGALTGTLLKKYSVSFLMIPRLIDLAYAVL